ncbi:ribosomal protein L11 methyltransferase-domain-containing protein, partial [Pelagophyceae sp. CCMP2097]
GRHPTTALCLECWSPGARMLDYGCGTGVLLCAAAMLGCGDVVGVDIDDEILKVARLNVAANDLEGVEITHGRHVVPGAFAPADVVVANILVGALSRPSMVATLALGCKPGAKLCLSGFRPGAETEVLLQLYRPFFTFDQSGYAERAPDAHGQEYRGTWTRVVATRNVDSAETRRQLIDKIADDAVNG